MFHMVLEEVACLCMQADVFWVGSVLYTRKVLTRLNRTVKAFRDIQTFSIAFVRVSRYISKVATCWQAKSMVLRPALPPYCALDKLWFCSARCMKPLDECHFHMRFKSASIKCSVRSLLIYGRPGSFSRYKFQIVCHRLKVWVCFSARTMSQWMSCIRSIPFVVTGSPGFSWCWSLSSIL